MTRVAQKASCLCLLSNGLQCVSPFLGFYLYIYLYKYITLLYFMCMNALLACMSVCCMHPQGWSPPDSLELGLQVDVSHHVGAWNWTQLLWRGTSALYSWAEPSLQRHHSPLSGFWHGLWGLKSDPLVFPRLNHLSSPNLQNFFWLAKLKSLNKSLS